ALWMLLRGAVEGITVVAAQGLCDGTGNTASVEPLARIGDALDVLAAAGSVGLWLSQKRSRSQLVLPLLLLSASSSFEIPAAMFPIQNAEPVWEEHDDFRAFVWPKGLGSASRAFEPPLRQASGVLVGEHLHVYGEGRHTDLHPYSYRPRPVPAVEELPILIDERSTFHDLRRAVRQLPHGTQISILWKTNNLAEATTARDRWRWLWASRWTMRWRRRWRAPEVTATAAISAWCATCPAAAGWAKAPRCCR
ncbi:MAG: hypothetical protein AAGA23_15695, partial [Pseudomonadota bacterium]